jgi:TetR/AcrR family transcriptional regulator
VARAADHRSRSERTRAAVLDAGEVLFAERGFDATRLEDVALRVGIRRASIVYYYRDKRDLYDAVLARVLGDLRERLEPALGSEAPLAARIEAAVSAWVGFVGTRPALARILLREAADATPERRAALLAHTETFTALIRRHVLDRPDFRRARLERIDPVHVASTVVGTTVFLVAAMPYLVPDRERRPLDHARLAAHEAEMLRVVRRLLGTRARALSQRPASAPRGRNLKI